MPGGSLCTTTPAPRLLLNGEVGDPFSEAFWWKFRFTEKSGDLYAGFEHIGKWWERKEGRKGGGLVDPFFSF